MFEDKDEEHSEESDTADDQYPPEHSRRIVCAYQASSTYEKGRGSSICDPTRDVFVALPFRGKRATSSRIQTQGF